MNLSGKTALIAGGARMGVVVGSALARQGCRIALTWRSSRESADSAVVQLAAQKHEAMAVQCDLADPASIDQALKAVQKSFSRIDIVVNLASIYEANDLSKDQAAKAWHAHMTSNAQAAYQLSIAAAPFLKQGGGGRMIHISDWTSASGRPRYKEYTAYYVSKVAIKGVVEGLALALAPDILVNAIAPGPMLPPPGMSKEEQEAVEKATPLGRWGGAEEMAKTIVFLAETDFITGETIRLDGGRHLY